MHEHMKESISCSEDSATNALVHIKKEDSYYIYYMKFDIPFSIRRRSAENKSRGAPSHNAITMQCSSFSMIFQQPRKKGRRRR